LRFERRFLFGFWSFEWCFYLDFGALRDVFCWLGRFEQIILGWAWGAKAAVVHILIEARICAKQEV
jgi:hypothetical protein